MSHLHLYAEPIVQTIRTRVSCRTYQDRLLAEEDKETLLDFCTKMKSGLRRENVSFRLIEYTAEDLRNSRLGGYGLFKNTRSFIVGVIDISGFHYVSFGYVMEHVVLKATELGLGTCWVGDFDPCLVRNLSLNDKQTIPAVCLVGYTAEKQTIKEKVARFAIKASKRKDWHMLFFNGDFKTALTPEKAGPYAESLELLRLAPSAGNTQPWRIVKDQHRNIFHFFKKVVNRRYEEKGLHNIDIGIAMCHFELGAARNRLSGSWTNTQHNIACNPDETQYIVSWIPE